MEANEHLGQSLGHHDAMMVTDLSGAISEDIKGNYLLDAATSLQHTQTTIGLAMHQDSSTSSSNTAGMLSDPKPQMNTDRKRSCSSCNKIFKKKYSNGSYRFNRYKLTTITSCLPKSVIKRTYPNLSHLALAEGYVCYTCRRKLQQHANAITDRKGVLSSNLITKTTTTANKVVPQNSEKHQDQTWKVLNATKRLLKPNMTSSSQRAVASQKTSVLKPTKPIARRMKSTPVSGPCAEFGYDLEIDLPFELIDLIKASPSTDPCHFYGKNGDDRLMIWGNKQQDGKKFKLLISGPRDFKERTDTVSCTVSDLVCLSPRQDHFKENLEPMMPKHETEANTQSNATETMSENQPGPCISKMLNLQNNERTSKNKDMFRRNSSEKENDEAAKHIQFGVVTADEEKKAAEMFQQDQDQCVQTASSLGSGNVIEELVATPSRSQEVVFSAEQQQPMSAFALSEELGLPNETDIFITSTSVAYNELSSIPNITWSEMNNADEIIVEVCTQNDDEVKIDRNDSAVTVDMCQNEGSLVKLGPEKNSNLNESAPADKQKNADDSDPDYVDDADADPAWETAEHPPEASKCKPTTAKTTNISQRKMDIESDRAKGIIIRCKLCPYTAEYKSLFRCHLYNFHKMSLTEYREKFNFPLIRRDNADYIKDLTDESNNYHGEPDPYRYRCKLCSFSQEHIRHFRNHLKKRHKLTFQTYFEQFGISGLYPSTVSGDIRKEETSFLCELCGRGFKKLAGLLSHLKSMHKKEGKCIINRLHTERTEQNNRRSAILKNCPFCQEKFLKADIISHINREHQDHEDFSNITEVLRKSISRSDKKAKTKARTLTKSKTECPLCTYSSTDPEDVYKHKLLIHSDLRKFVCPFCRASFNTPLALKKHTKSKHQKNSDIPTKGKQCPTCQRVFADKYNCNRHMLIHQKKATEMLICHRCLRRIGNFDKLLNHVRNVHGETGKVICKLCGFGVNKMHELVGHKCRLTTITAHKTATEATADVTVASKSGEEMAQSDDIAVMEGMDMTLEHEDIKDTTCESFSNSDNVLLGESSTPVSNAKDNPIFHRNEHSVVENLLPEKVGFGSGESEGMVTQE